MVTIGENHSLSEPKDNFLTYGLNKINSLKIKFYQFSEKYWADILWIWICGIILFICLHILTQRRVKRSLQLFSKEIEDEKILSIFSMAQKDLDIDRTVKIKYCSQIQSPVITGIFLPIIYIPENIELSAFEWRTVLRHELYHFRAYDLLYKEFIQCIQAILWFQPLMYYIKKCAYEDIEIETVGDNGIVGYVRAEELDSDKPNSLEETLEYMNNLPDEKTVFVYESDGQTIIDTFTICNGIVEYP